jgi:hypothetical protein
LIRGDPRFMRDVAMFGAPGGTVTRCSSPWGRYCATEVAGPEAIMTMIPKLTGRHATEVTRAEAIVTMIPELTGRRAYGMCGAFRFCAAAPPFHRPAPTDGRDPGPLVSAWI